MRIAFCYKKRSGKDTACEYLQKIHGGTIIQIARPLYQVCELIQKHYRLKVEKDRSLLEDIGEGLKGILYESVWIDSVVRKIKEIPEGEHIFVSDCRFPIEADMLKSLGFTIVNIYRPEHLREAASNSKSEIGLDDYKFDITICNYGTILDFYGILNENFKYFDRLIERVSLIRLTDKLNLD